MSDAYENFVDAALKQLPSLRSWPRRQPSYGPVTNETGKAVMDRLPKIRNNWLYLEEHKWSAYRFISIYHAITEIEDFGDYAQFGVFQGLTARFISRFLPPERRLHLFDSFEGLPEDWVATVPKRRLQCGRQTTKG